MRQFIVLLVIVMSLDASAGEVMESSYVMPDGQRVLRHEVLVAAPPEEVWKTLSPSEGLQSFGDPSVRYEILSFLPNQLLSLRIANTPPNFPQPELAKKVFTVIELVRINDPSTTRVRVSMLPYGTGAEWDAVYDFFRRQNAALLKKLEQKFAK
jgi:hypothetical protein